MSIVVRLNQLRDNGNEKESLGTINDALTKQKYPKAIGKAKKFWRALEEHAHWNKYEGEDFEKTFGHHVTNLSS